MTNSSSTGSDLDLRTVGPEHYESIIAVWEAAGLPHRPQGRDSLDDIERQMALDPDMWLGCFVRGALVGVVMGSYDFRKGWVNRLAVLPEHRRKGIAEALVSEMEARLRRRGLRIIAVLIDDGHDASMALFRKRGYAVHEDITYLSKRDDPDV